MQTPSYYDAEYLDADTGAWSPVSVITGLRFCRPVSDTQLADAFIVADERGHIYKIDASAIRFKQTQMKTQMKTQMQTQTLEQPQEQPAA